MIDKFYTPQQLAIELVQEIGAINPNLAVDPTCGSGNLLKAASETFESIHCVGMDRDPVIIRRLKKEQPYWTLSVADFRNQKSYMKTNAISAAVNCDLLLLNPPYSQIPNKYVLTQYRGKNIRSGIAMGFVLRSLEVFKPSTGALIIAPESMLYSELDDYARHIVRKNFKLTHLADLNASTFDGARARTVAIKLTHRDESDISLFPFNHSNRKIPVQIIRGGMQMHKVLPNNLRDGFKVVHSVDLKYFYKGIAKYSGFINKPVAGFVEGKHILLPRVGIPDIDNTQIINFESQVQLSDCVIAITTKREDDLLDVLKCIKSKRQEFIELYKGTGARYTTISRLIQWMSLNGINCIS